ncbi:MAG: DnaA regulatory inactivator Hda [Woeseiaceae bacterium]|nr:DnaA regulatory inactivator Hda [Woeseiaceae bacterium]
MSQLALPLQLADHAVFASFHDAGNEEVVAYLCGVADGSVPAGCWLKGAPSTGKTHLLQAVCERAGDEAVYLPMQELAAAGPELIEGLDARAVVCLDDIDTVAGDPAWERALFVLYNDLQNAAHRLVVSAPMSPRDAGFELQDLGSRMSQLPIYSIHALADAERAVALQLRARHRGLELPDESAKYLLSRSRRDMSSLYALLDTLDAAALRAQRRITIPFVREVLDELAERD